jgi:WXG100 protein secretion system (Wss), protein YukD
MGTDIMNNKEKVDEVSTSRSDDQAKQENENKEYISLKIYSMGGTELEVEAPIDISIDSLVAQLLTCFQLPFKNAESHSINWRLDNMDTGRSLEFNKTLRECGVESGHRLMLLRQTVAG